MYKCLGCGHIFDEGEEAKWSERMGEFWGTPAYKEMNGCPKCHGDFAETDRCDICGSEHLEDELNGGVCEECIDKYRHDFKTCYKISSGYIQAVEINELLASLFDASDIEQILVEHVKKRCPDIDCSEFIDSDISWFGENLTKEVKK